MLRRTLPLFVLLVIAAACGGKNNIQATDQPEFQIEGPGFIEIRVPATEERNQPQDALILRNRGDGPLQITSMEWIDQPERLIAIGERGGSCADGCAENEVCLTSSMTCAAVGLPAVPFTIDRQSRTDVDFLVTKGTTELSCPEPGADVPTDIQPRYCGAVKITTNADNDFADTVTDGAATIYFLDPGASGQIEVDPTFLEYTNVQPGTTQTQTFSITNTGMNDLTIETMGVEDNSAFFTYTHSEGQNLPVTIPSGTSDLWEVTLSIPAETTDYETFTSLNIESSAGVAKVAIEVTADAGSAPVIELSDTVLKFDTQATQTLTVTNSGMATLALQGLSVQPASSRTFYRFEIDGNDVTDTFQNVNIPMGGTKDIVVSFERPQDNTESSVGILEISHNDRNKGFISEVTLLGDEGDVPIAQLQPASFTFLAEDGNSESRRFVVRNVGTAALDITGITWNFSTGSNAEFQISPTTGNVAAGGLFEGTVNFTGMNATADVGLAVLDSNNASDIELSLRATASAQEQPVPVITVQNQGALVASSPVNLTATDSTPDGAETNAIWTMVSRPAASTTFLDAVGGDASFIPDVAGTYQIALTILSGDREAQTVTDIVVE